MNRIDWNTVKATAMPATGGSVTRQFVHGEQSTLARIAFTAGASLPAHRHHNEQFSTVLSGRMEFLVGEETTVVETGESIHLPSEMWHGAVALEDSVVLDVFAPPRADWT